MALCFFVSLLRVYIYRNTIKNMKKHHNDTKLKKGFYVRLDAEYIFIHGSSPSEKASWWSPRNEGLANLAQLGER